LTNICRFAVAWLKSRAIMLVWILVQKCILREHERRKQEQEEKKRRKTKNKMNARQQGHSTMIPDENGTHKMRKLIKWEAKNGNFQ